MLPPKTCRPGRSLPLSSSPQDTCLSLTIVGFFLCFFFLINRQRLSVLCVKPIVVYLRVLRRVSKDNDIIWLDSLNTPPSLPPPTIRYITNNKRGVLIVFAFHKYHYSCIQRFAGIHDPPSDSCAEFNAATQFGDGNRLKFRL